MRRAEKSGLGSAYRAGFGWGLAHGFEVLIEMDSDLQHDPAMLPALIHAVEDGADLAIGSRYVPGGSVPGWKWSRRLLSQGGNIYAAMVLGLHVRDLTAGFRAYARHGAVGHRPGRGQGRRLRLPDRDGLRRRRQRRAHRRGADRLRQRERGTSKMSSYIVVEALAMVTWWALRDRVLKRGRPKPTTRVGAT